MYFVQTFLVKMILISMYRYVFHSNFGNVFLDYNSVTSLYFTTLFLVYTTLFLQFFANTDPYFLETGPELPSV